MHTNKRNVKLPTNLSYFETLWQLACLGLYFYLRVHINFLLCCYHNKLPQTGCLETIEIYSLTVWRPDFQNQRVSRAILLLESLGEESVLCLFQFLLAAGIPSLWPHHSNLCIHGPIAFSSSVCLLFCVSVFYKDTRDCI